MELNVSKMGLIHPIMRTWDKTRDYRSYWHILWWPLYCKKVTYIMLTNIWRIEIQLKWHHLSSLELSVPSISFIDSAQLLKILDFTKDPPCRLQPVSYILLPGIISKCACHQRKWSLWSVILTIQLLFTSGLTTSKVILEKFHVETESNVNSCLQGLD